MFADGFIELALKDGGKKRLLQNVKKPFLLFLATFYTLKNVWVQAEISKRLSSFENS